MAIDGIAEAAVQVVAEATAQATGEVAADKVKRRFGWKGCALSMAIIAAVIVGLVLLH